MNISNNETNRLFHSCVLDVMNGIRVKAPAIILVFSFCYLVDIEGQAQRGHEIQAQVGLMFNKGVSFYNYRESDTRRHNFEFDQQYTSNFITLSWRYPINSYLETGIYFSNSLSATLLLLEAESILFDSNNPDIRGPSPLFLGKTRLSSSNRELGMDVRVSVARFNKFKTYVVLNAGIQRISTTRNSIQILEVQDQNLRENLLKTYLVNENIHTLGVCLGLSRSLSNGFHLKIIEVYGKAIAENKLFLSFPVSLEFRTGVSYQFYRRK